VKPPFNNYVSSRVLRLNVGFLLNDGPAHNHETTFDVPAIRVAEDLYLHYIRGTLRLSRTKEGILLQGQLHVGIQGECYRCLEPVLSDAEITVEELYGYPVPKGSEFAIHDDGILDIAPLLRAEALIISARGLLCRPDCKGLCPECGANFNTGTCACAFNAVDPRFASLRHLLDDK
jgi:uncharacterized protein